VITTVITKLLFEPKRVSSDCQVEFGRIQTVLLSIKEPCWAEAEEVGSGMIYLTVLYKFHTL